MAFVVGLLLFVVVVGVRLWQRPWPAIAIEPGLVLAGSHLYRRAALPTRSAATPDGRRWVLLVSAVLLASGLATLALDAFAA